MPAFNRSLLRNFQLLLLAVLFQLAPWGVCSVHAAVINGDFIYVQEGDGSLLHYHVHEVDFQGIPAWRISWDHQQLQAEHYVRRSDGMPMYVKRINHALKHTVEIIYSQNSGKPSIYRKRSENEFIERKIWDASLRDLGVLPQFLPGSGADDSKQDIIFSIINYADGKVYQLIARQVGYRLVKTAENSVRCVIYEVKLDSWKSAFMGTTRLLIPSHAQDSNFVSYNGPGLDGVARRWKLKLVGKDTALALLNKEK